jgi:glycosyltransferase involved in cell wall biosynthesis
LNIDEAIVRICIPTFNVAHTIVDSLKSLLNQTYRNIDYIVIDNCSTDNTLELVQAFNDPRLRIIKNTHNLGAEGNFTKCIENARGKYTAIFHADDIYEPTMVEEQIKFLESCPSVNAVFTEAFVIDESSAVTGSIQMPAKIRNNAPIFTFEDIFKSILKNSNFLICPSAMVRTELYQKEIRVWRGYLFETSADLDVWLRILMLGPIGILPKKLMRYRISAQQESARVRLNFERADFFKVIDHYLTLDRVKATLSLQDQKNYRCLERRDLAMRAVNLFISGNQLAAVKLCPSLLDMDLLQDALYGKRGLGVLIAVLCLKVLPAVGLEGTATFLFKYAKIVLKK